MDHINMREKKKAATRLHSSKEALRSRGNGQRQEETHVGLLHLGWTPRKIGLGSRPGAVQSRARVNAQEKNLVHEKRGRDTIKKGLAG